MSSRNQIIEKLFQTQAIQLNAKEPFKWSSGILSPIYCDNRKLLSYPIHRDYIKSELSNTYLEFFDDSQIIVGVATAGISWGVLMADQIKLPFLYVRATSKEHGLKKNIEGYFEEKQKALVVEDLVSTGKSSMNVVEILRQNALEVVGVVSIFSYNFPQTQELFDREKVKYKTLLTYDELLDYAEQNAMFSKEELESLKHWRINPQTWKPM